MFAVVAAVAAAVGVLDFDDVAVVVVAVVYALIEHIIAVVAAVVVAVAVADARNVAAEIADAVDSVAETFDFERNVDFAFPENVPSCVFFLQHPFHDHHNHPYR